MKTRRDVANKNENVQSTNRSKGGRGRRVRGIFLVVLGKPVVLLSMKRRKEKGVRARSERIS